MARGAVRALYHRMLERYGEQGWWPLGGRYDPSFKRRPKTPRERLEVSWGAILAQSTSWPNAARALRSLREAGVSSRRRLLGLEDGALEELVRSAGYFRQKARKLRAFARYRGAPDRERLLGVWGLGPETVDSILLYAHDVALFVVDAYTRRILSRLGLARPDAAYREIQDLFHRGLPRRAPLFNEYHALLVRHAKEHCRKRPLCDGCPVLDLCAHGEAESRRAWR